jgi:hypothetical protein
MWFKPDAVEPYPASEMAGKPRAVAEQMAKGRPTWRPVSGEITSGPKSRTPPVTSGSVSIDPAYQIESFDKEMKGKISEWKKSLESIEKNPPKYEGRRIELPKQTTRLDLALGSAKDAAKSAGRAVAPAARAVGGALARAAAGLNHPAVMVGLAAPEAGRGLDEALGISDYIAGVGQHYRPPIQTASQKAALEVFDSVLDERSNQLAGESMGSHAPVEPRTESTAVPVRDIVGRLQTLAQAGYEDDVAAFLEGR